MFAKPTIATLERERAAKAARSAATASNASSVSAAKPSRAAHQRPPSGNDAVRFSAAPSRPMTRSRSDPQRRGVVANSKHTPSPGRATGSAAAHDDAAARVWASPLPLSRLHGTAVAEYEKERAAVDAATAFDDAQQQQAEVDAVERDHLAALGFEEHGSAAGMAAYRFPLASGRQSSVGGRTSSRGASSPGRHAYAGLVTLNEAERGSHWNEGCGDGAASPGALDRALERSGSVASVPLSRTAMRRSRQSLSKDRVRVSIDDGTIDGMSALIGRSFNGPHRPQSTTSRSPGRKGRGLLSSSASTEYIAGDDETVREAEEDRSAVLAALHGAISSTYKEAHKERFPELFDNAVVDPSSPNRSASRTRRGLDSLLDGSDAASTVAGRSRRSASAPAGRRALTVPTPSAGLPKSALDPDLQDAPAALLERIASKRRELKRAPHSLQDRAAYVSTKTKDEIRSLTSNTDGAGGAAPDGPTAMVAAAAKADAFDAQVAAGRIVDRITKFQNVIEEEKAAEVARLAQEEVLKKEAEEAEREKARRDALLKRGITRSPAPSRFIVKGRAKTPPPRTTGGRLKKTTDNKPTTATANPSAATAAGGPSVVKPLSATPPAENSNVTSSASPLPLPAPQTAGVKPVQSIEDVTAEMLPAQPAIAQVPKRLVSSTRRRASDATPPPQPKTGAQRRTSATASSRVGVASDAKALTNATGQEKDQRPNAERQRLASLRKPVPPPVGADRLVLSSPTRSGVSSRGHYTAGGGGDGHTRRTTSDQVSAEQVGGGPPREFEDHGPRPMPDTAEVGDSAGRSAALRRADSATFGHMEMSVDLTSPTVAAAEASAAQLEAVDKAVRRAAAATEAMLKGSMPPRPATSNREGQSREDDTNESADMIGGRHRASFATAHSELIHSPQQHRPIQTREDHHGAASDARTALEMLAQTPDRGAHESAHGSPRGAQLGAEPSSATLAMLRNRYQGLQLQESGTVEPVLRDGHAGLASPDPRAPHAQSSPDQHRLHGTVQETRSGVKMAEPLSPPKAAHPPSSPKHTLSATNLAQLSSMGADKSDGPARVGSIQSADAGQASQGEEGRRRPAENEVGPGQARQALPETPTAGRKKHTPWQEPVHAHADALLAQLRARGHGTAPRLQSEGEPDLEPPGPSARPAAEHLKRIAENVENTRHVAARVAERARSQEQQHAASTQAPIINERHDENTNDDGQTQQAMKEEQPQDDEPAHVRIFRALKARSAVTGHVAGDTATEATHTDVTSHRQHKQHGGGGQRLPIHSMASRLVRGAPRPSVDARDWLLSSGNPDASAPALHSPSRHVDPEHEEQGDQALGSRPMAREGRDVRATELRRDSVSSATTEGTASFERDQRERRRVYDEMIAAAGGAIASASEEPQSLASPHQQRDGGLDGGGGRLSQQQDVVAPRAASHRSIGSPTRPNAPRAQDMAPFTPPVVAEAVAAKSSVGEWYTALLHPPPMVDTAALPIADRGLPSQPPSSFPDGRERSLLTVPYRSLLQSQRPSLSADGRPRSTRRSSAGLGHDVAPLDESSGASADARVLQVLADVDNARWGHAWADVARYYEHAA